MMRGITQEEVFNAEQIHRRRNIRTLDDRNQEQPDVLATEFQEIEIDEESDDSWSADEFVDDDLQCDRKNKLAERISTWRKEVDQQNTNRRP